MPRNARQDVHNHGPCSTFLPKSLRYEGSLHGPCSAPIAELRSADDAQAGNTLLLNLTVRNAHHRTAQAPVHLVYNTTSATSCAENFPYRQRVANSDGRGSQQRQDRSGLLYGPKSADEYNLISDVFFSGTVKARTSFSTCSDSESCPMKQASSRKLGKSET